MTHWVRGRTQRVIGFVTSRVRDTCLVSHGDDVVSDEDVYDVLSCRSLSAKEPLIIGLFCGKRRIKIRHPMGLGHPVLSC